MSNHSIGNKFELEAKHELERKGFIVFKPVRTRFSVTDVFGVFDLLAYNPTSHQLKFLQITSLEDDKKNIEKISTVKSRIEKVKTFQPDFVEVELGCYIRNKDKKRYKWTTLDSKLSTPYDDELGELILREDCWKIKK